MKRFKNILVIVKDNHSIVEDPSVARGFALAKQNGARLTLMDVIPKPDGAISRYKGILDAEELTHVLVKERVEALEKIASGLVSDAGSDVDIDVQVKVGRDFIEIIRKVILDKHDLLIKVANDTDSSFDSSDFHLMRKCPEPVWLLRPKAKSGAQKVLAAVDLTLEQTTEGKALNKFILDLATSLARWDNTELHMLSCWSLYGENALRYSSFMKVPDDEVEKILEKEEQANHDLQKTLTGRYEDVEITNHLVKGSPIEVIPSFTKKNNIDVVVMGTVARTGIAGLLIGNTAETVLSKLDASVITLKPSGFESPVK